MTQLASFVELERFSSGCCKSHFSCLAPSRDSFNMSDMNCPNDLGCSHHQVSGEPSERAETALQGQPLVSKAV